MISLNRIVYSDHAKNQLIERNISLQWVEKTLLEPQQTITGNNNRMIAHRVIIINNENFLLRVIYENNGTQLEVITAYLTTKINKYWRYEP